MTGKLWTGGKGEEGTREKETKCKGANRDGVAVQRCKGETRRGPVEKWKRGQEIQCKGANVQRCKRGGKRQ